MKRLGLVVVICWGGAAFAGTCEPGYYPANGECTICPTDHACPDGDSIIKCTSFPAQYTDGTGSTACKTCPGTDKLTNSEYLGYFSNIRSSLEGYGIYNCRAEWNNVPTQHGTKRFSCSYRSDAYDGNDVSASKCMVDMISCDPGYKSASFYYYQGIAFARMWFDSFEAAAQVNCIPAGIGSYSADGDLNATACPAGTSTRTATAASIDECLPLCTGGATKLHAGAYAFNLWRDKYTTPAMNIRLAGGNICYANIESGKGNLNINYNDTIYHVTN